MAELCRVDEISSAAEIPCEIFLVVAHLIVGDDRGICQRPILVAKSITHASRQPAIRDISTLAVFLLGDLHLEAIQAFLQIAQHLQTVNTRVKSHPLIESLNEMGSEQAYPEILVIIFKEARDHPKILLGQSIHHAQLDIFDRSSVVVLIRAIQPIYHPLITRLRCVGLSLGIYVIAPI